MLDSRAVGRASVDADRRAQRLFVEGDSCSKARASLANAEASAIAGRITSEWAA